MGCNPLGCVVHVQLISISFGSLLGSCTCTTDGRRMDSARSLRTRLRSSGGSVFGAEYLFDAPVPDFLLRQMPNILSSSWSKIQPKLPKEHARLGCVTDSSASLRDPPLPGSLPLSAGNIARRLVSVAGKPAHGWHRHLLYARN